MHEAMWNFSKYGEVKNSYSYSYHLCCIVMIMHGRGVTNCCQILYTSTEILFEINEITRFLKSEIKKIGVETSKIL